MSALTYRLLLIFAVCGAYFWLQVPELQRYSLQVFAVVLAAYFGLKRLSKGHVWHLAPNLLSAEMPLVTFGFLILIGSTGNLHSLFFPLMYVWLFFLIFASDFVTAILIMGLSLLFHYGLSPELTPNEISALVSLPLIGIFFWFAKNQYQTAQSEKELLVAEESSLISSEQAQVEIETFMASTLYPKLDQLNRLLDYPHHNQTTLKGQITWLQLQVHQQLNRRPTPVPATPSSAPGNDGVEFAQPTNSSSTESAPPATS